MDHSAAKKKLTLAGLIITLGIIYGDIGTSPLYVLKAIIGKDPINETIVLGSLSCIFWTLTLLTTVKYVIITLRADNQGEGGIFSLYALVRRRYPNLIYAAMIGGAALIADGVLTPPISVSSAVEGLTQRYPDLQTLPIVLAIITGIFILQRFGTQIVGKAFGPIMTIWFLMLAVLGVYHLTSNWGVLKALNPYYAYVLLAKYPGGFWLLSGIFLCATGAEALYSDLGHCGRQNIRASWIYVKSALLLNYFGQGAWLLSHLNESLDGRIPFYELMPPWFLLPGITIATLAAIIASQAVISGSFTLISEGMRLGLWPKVKINFPTEEKGQIYVSSVNWILWFGCIVVVCFFQESANMEAAYGLAINICMIMTTYLLNYYLKSRKVKRVWIGLLLSLFIIIELSFLVANLSKFSHGGWFALVVAIFFFLIMWVWLRAKHIKNRLTEYVPIKDYLPQLVQLSNDTSIPKYATHLVYLSGGKIPDEIETKTIYSIIEKQPKRADIYWFVHIDITDKPYTLEYSVQQIAPNDVIRVDFKLGFRVEHKTNLYFKKVLQEMVKNHEIDITHKYGVLKKEDYHGDFKFVVLEKHISYENNFSAIDKFILDAYFALKHISLSEDKAFGLDTSSVTVEKVPMFIVPIEEVKLKRV